MCEALSSGPVIRLCGEDPVHSAVHLQDGDAERRASEFVHQHMTVEEKRNGNEAFKLKVTINLRWSKNSYLFPNGESCPIP